MRIIDKNTDFYDFYQGIYRDESLVFDRRDSFILTREKMGEALEWYCYHNRYLSERKNGWILMQIGHTFWLFEYEGKEEKRKYAPTKFTYELKLAHTWKNYNKERKLITLEVIKIPFFWNAKLENVVDSINNSQYEVFCNLDQGCIIKDGNVKEYRTIPILKACGIGNCVEALDVYLAFEEFFSLEKSKDERRETVGLTDAEKVENHGFDKKKSFRGKP